MGTSIDIAGLIRKVEAELPTHTDPSGVGGRVQAMNTHGYLYICRFEVYTSCVSKVLN